MIAKIDVEEPLDKQRYYIDKKTKMVKVPLEEFIVPSDDRGLNYHTFISCLKTPDVAVVINAKTERIAFYCKKR